MHKHVPLGGFWTPGFRCQVGRETLYPLPEVFQLLEKLRKKTTFNLVGDEFVHPGSIPQSVVQLFCYLFLNNFYLILKETYSHFLPK